MAVLVGSTGYVGGHLAAAHPFEVQVHRPDVAELVGAQTDLMVCAGLPAEKWRANAHPDEDWSNMARLAQVLASVRADRAVLISTIDVYQPAVGVDETTPAQFDGAAAYGAHRAWFEAFFRAKFSGCLVMRLPGLFSADVRKNLVHDLMHGKSDQWGKVNPRSTFQFFDTTRTWEIAQRAMAADIGTLNITAEPVTAQEVADLFGVALGSRNPVVEYDMRSVHAEAFGGRDGYVFTKQQVLAGIAALREPCAHP